MPPENLIALARSIAARHDLYPELVCAVVEQESSWNPWAMRYEPAFYDRYVAPLRGAGKTSTETEARARATSWGLMQVMGEVAREAGFTGQFLSALCDPATGLEIGCAALARNLAAAEGSVARALELWNGGANAEYASQVLARAGKFKP